MTIYLLPIILTGLAYATSLWRIASIDRTVLLFSTVVAALFAGLRWNSDVDYLGYLEIYTDTPNLSDFRAETIYDLYGEPAYLLLNSILKSVGVEFYFVTMICAFSSLALKSYVSAKMSKRASLGICLYLCIHFLTIEFIQNSLGGGFIATYSGFLFSVQEEFDPDSCVPCAGNRVSLFFFGFCTNCPAYGYQERAPILRMPFYYGASRRGH